MAYHNEIEQHIDRFPDMPSLCQKLIGFLEDPEVDFKQIAEIIEYDPGLTANILKFANSVFFGSFQKINSLQAALVRLGTKTVLELVLCFAVSSRLAPGLPGYGLESKELLKHSIWTAVAAKELASTLEMKHVDMIFTTGLMHDLGMLLIDPFIQKEDSCFRKLLEKPDASFEQEERKILGIDHAQAGAMILDKWRMGAELVTGVRWHHEPENATEYQDLVHLIHLADMLALSGGVGAGNYGMQYRVSPKTIEMLGLKKSHIESAASKTLDKMKELENILG